MTGRLSKGKQQTAIKLVESLEKRLVEQISRSSLGPKSLSFLYSTIKAAGLSPESADDWFFIEKAAKSRISYLASLQFPAHGDYIKLENIVCVNSNGRVFESHPELYIASDIIRNQDKSQVSKTPYQWIAYHEQNGLFLPSFALSCNILAALFKDKSNPEINNVLMDYKNKGNGNGWHAQNTIIDYASEEIIHYPSAADFGQVAVVNAVHKRISRSFSKSTLCDKTLEEALKIPDFAKYAKNLTGLEEPLVLVEIGKYFNKPAKVWFPWNKQNGKDYNEKRACWLGCCYGNFNLLSYVNLNISWTSRGVRKKIP